MDIRQFFNDLDTIRKVWRDMRKAKVSTVMLVDRTLSETEKQDIHDYLTGEKHMKRYGRKANHPVSLPTMPVDDDFRGRTVHCTDRQGKVEQEGKLRRYELER